jgi:ABC-type multidrug transport system fused ATPase/permease subunit
MEDGRIKDIGNHDTLMADPNGSYKKFVKLQAG